MVFWHTSKRTILRLKQGCCTTRRPFSLLHLESNRKPANKKLADKKRSNKKATGKKQSDKQAPAVAAANLRHQARVEAMQILKKEQKEVRELSREIESPSDDWHQHVGALTDAFTAAGKLSQDLKNCQAPSRGPKPRPTWKQGS